MKGLVEGQSFEQGDLLEPFGEGRGKVLARRGRIMVMSASDLDQGGVVIVTVQPTLQSILWAFNEGLKAQYSNIELEILTGATSYDSLIQETKRDLDQAEKSIHLFKFGGVRQSKAGADDTATFSRSEVDPVCDEGVPEYPAGYFATMDHGGGAVCNP